MLGRVTQFSLSFVTTIVDGIGYVISSGLTSLSDLFIGEAWKAIKDGRGFIKKDLTKRALEQKNGMAIARIGPPIKGLHTNLVVIAPSSSNPQSTSMISDVLSAAEKDPQGRSPMNAFAEMTGRSNIVTATGKEGLEYRKVFAPYVNDKNDFLDLAHGMLLETLHKWTDENDGIMLLNEMRFLIRSISSRRLFGEIPLSPDENDQVNEIIRLIKQKMLYRLSWKVSREFNEGKLAYKKYSRGFITNHKNDIFAGLNTPHTNLMIDLLKKEKGANSKEDIEKHLYDQSIASAMLSVGLMDSVYSILTCIIFYLSQHPEFADELYKELKSACNDKGSIGYDKLRNKDLVHLHCLVEEGLRYVSTVPMVTRYTTHGIHTDNMDIPASSTVLINFDSMHHSSKEWGEDADVFNPNRFVDDKDEATYKTPPLIPFSLGARDCPGSRVAKSIMKLIVSEVVLKCEICPAVGQSSELTIDNESSFVPDPVPDYQVRFVPRETLELTDNNNIQPEQAPEPEDRTYRCV